MTWLMAIISNAITMAIVAADVTTIPILISRSTKSTKLKTKENGEKSIDAGKFIYFLVYGFSALFIVLGLWVGLFADSPIAGIIFIALGLIIVIPMAVFQFADTSVDWSNVYLIGAKSGMSIKKNHILWENVVSAKLHPNQTIQIKDKSGKSVFWSVYYLGWHEIIEDLRRIRPDIDTSDFE